MPQAARRLSLHLLPLDPDASIEALRGLHGALLAGGWLLGDGPGPRPLVAGGFARARLELNADVRFASNWQGGFRVACPVTGDGVVEPFVRALGAWRAGGPRRLSCPCGATHDLAALAYAPEAGFARGWITLIDVASPEIDPEAVALPAALACGGLRLVPRRG